MERRALVIIGGGPAGLAAGIYAARADLDTVLLERGVPGGLVINTELIENYPGFKDGIGGYELMSQMKDQARKFGLDIYSANVNFCMPKDDERFIIKTDSGDFEAGAVIVATGANPQKLGVRGENEYIGRGVSYCATCDGAFFRGQRVAVVGGGDAAVEEAVFLTRFAERVFIIHRRGELRATKVVQKKALENKKIEFIWHSVVEEIYGDDTVKGVVIKDVRNNEKSNLDVSGIFIYIGYKPNSSPVKDLVNLDENGYIITDENMLTSRKGIFAAGDVRKKLLRQIVTAVADGAIAAVSAEKYLTKSSS